MSTARNIIRFLLNPTEPGERILRTSILFHWAIGLILFLGAAERSLPSRVMWMMYILITSFLAAVFVNLAAQIFWEWRIKRRLHADQGSALSMSDYIKREHIVYERARELEVASAASVVKQLLYLAPGIPIGWAMLPFFLFFISGGNE